MKGNGQYNQPYKAGQQRHQYTARISFQEFMWSSFQSLGTPHAPPWSPPRSVSASSPARMAYLFWWRLFAPPLKSRPRPLRPFKTLLDPRNPYLKYLCTGGHWIVPTSSPSMWYILKGYFWNIRGAVFFAVSYYPLLLLLPIRVWMDGVQAVPHPVFPNSASRK